MRLLIFISLLVLSMQGRADSTRVQQPDSVSVAPGDTASIANPLVRNAVVIPDTIARKDSTAVIQTQHLRVQNTETWVFVACCFTFFLAGLNRRINDKKHDQSILGFLSLGMLGQATDRSFYEFNIHQLLGLAVHNLVIALWVFYFLKGTDYQFVDSTLLFFILLFFLVSIVYLCKFFFQYLALNILQINDLPVLLVKCNIGLGYFAFLISLPVFMVVYYVQYPEWNWILVRIFMVVMGIYLLFRSFKYVQLFAQFFRASIFYNILYLCGLEFIPMLVLIKIGVDIFKIN